MKEDYYIPLKKECPHKDDCKSHPMRCGSCKNNPENEDHYKPLPFDPNHWIEPKFPFPDRYPRYWCQESYC